MQAATRWLARRNCLNRYVTSWPDGEWHFIKVDTSLPRLTFASSFPATTYELYQRPETFVTPKLLTTGINSNYRSQLFVVPDGRWHLNKCPESLA